MDLTNASAIITGGAGGLGSATVRRLAQKGAKALTVRATRSATSENSVKLDFSHLVAYHIAPVRLSTKALGTFCGSLAETNPQEVPLQRTYSCWKVHSLRKGAREYKPY